MNKTIIFSDLEGTMLRESDHSYSDEDMFNFLQCLDCFCKTTNSIPEIHLVSPIEGKSMDKYLTKIDKNIRSFKKITQSNISYIHRAYCSQDRDFSARISSNIIATKPPTERNFQSWKSVYVQEVCRRNTQRFPDDMLYFIYFGNGRNDFKAMEINKQYHGKNICPQNSRTAVKALSDFVGNY